MKFITLILLSIIVIAMSKKVNKNHGKNKSHHHSKTESTQILNFYASNAQNYVPFARLAYCNKAVVQTLSCPFCNNFQNIYNSFFIHSVTQENNRLFQFVIVYSDVKREIIISFSGPTTEHGNYFTNIYLNGFVTVPELGGIRVEREYWAIYSQHMRQILAEKLAKISAAGRADYTFIFVGHSFGGSLATLASYDLVMNNLVPRKLNSPLVFTYGPLRIGDAEFVNRVNAVVKVVKILRNDDYVTRMPNCVFINGNYRCYNNINSVAHRVPQLQNYLTGYKRIFAGFKEMNNDPIVRGTTYIAGRLFRTHVPMFYSQPFGTELIYNGPNFRHFQPCRYINSVPVCERNMRLPATFSPDVHRFYYNMNIEQC